MFTDFLQQKLVEIFIKARCNIWWMYQDTDRLSFSLKNNRVEGLMISAVVIGDHTPCLDNKKVSQFVEGSPVWHLLRRHCLFMSTSF